MVEIGRVEIKHAIRGLFSRIAGIQNHVQRLSARQSDRVRVVVEVVSRLISQQLGVVPDDVHRNTERSQRLILGNVQIGNAQQRLFACRNVDDGRQRL